MHYMRFSQYVYLAASLYFFYLGIKEYQENVEGFWIWPAIGAMSVFMFFFRRKFAKRFDHHDRDSKSR